MPAPDEIAAALAQIGSQYLLLDPANHRVSFAQPGLEINLGSIGKGYALDRVVQMLWKEWHIANLLVHGGHSSIFALGSSWPVSLSDPRDPRRQMGLFHLCDRALGTSSATYQHIVHEGRKLGHILDPRTGWPAEGMLSATATAPSAALAERAGHGVLHSRIPMGGELLPRSSRHRRGTHSRRAPASAHRAGKSVRGVSGTLERFAPCHSHFWHFQQTRINRRFLNTRPEAQAKNVPAKDEPPSLALQAGVASRSYCPDCGNLLLTRFRAQRTAHAPRERVISRSEMSTNDNPRYE